jgi:hypothetical protein
VVQVAELPRLGSGKTDYVTLRSLAEKTRPTLVEVESGSA